MELVSFRYTGPYRAEHPAIEDRPYLNVVAQQYVETFPEYVKSSGAKVPGSEAEILQVDTHPLIIYSAAAIQELNRKVETQARTIESRDDRIAELERRLEALEARLAKAYPFGQ